MRDERCEVLCLDLELAESLRRSRLAQDAAQAAAQRARAFSDPTRLSLIATLAEADELCVCDLAWVTERAQNLVSHHLRSLRSDGLVTSRREGKMVLYSITEEARHLLAAALGRRVVA